MIKRPDDETILENFHRGSHFKEEAFKLLVKSYGPLLYNQIRRVTRNHEWTNDVLQNVFVKVFQNLDGFNKDSSLYTWIYRITHNETLNFIEKEKRRSGLDLDPSFIEQQSGEMESVDPEILQQNLLRAIDSLPEKQAMVFKLRYFDELKFSEISELLGQSEGGLKANYHHARQKIEQFLIERLNH